MSKKKCLIISIFVFFALFLYVHQKIQIYVEGYNLTKSYYLYNEYVDRRDYLMYNLMRELSLQKINDWVERENFSSIKKEKVLVLHPKTYDTLNKEEKIVSAKHNIKIKFVTPIALAKEQE
ncbi:MAG: hypothetical protein NC925_04170 [Candidatus Omnitrophica bacterium]|nr:hypothetical protein [Candidatus Omnitrophota bacterium]MCM8830927.1 hypothetical protein [Candidatus Omnitrophota bacterium]